MGRSRKTQRRLKIIDHVTEALVHPGTFSVIDYRSRSEGGIKTFMYKTILRALEDLHRELSPSTPEDRISRKAQHSLVWEGDVRRTIHHLTFMGVQHRPDFEVSLRGTEIAIEVKRIDSGGAVREGIGQAIVYAQKYDFVIFLAIDITPDQAVRTAVEDMREQAFLQRIWELHNVRFAIV